MRWKMDCHWLIAWEEKRSSDFFITKKRRGTFALKKY